MRDCGNLRKRVGRSCIGKPAIGDAVGFRPLDQLYRLFQLWAGGEGDGDVNSNGNINGNWRVNRNVNTPRGES